MKRLLLIALCCIGIGTMLIAQENVYVYTSDDQVITYPLAQLDSMGFSSPQSLLTITGPHFVREDQTVELSTQWSIDGKQRVQVDWYQPEYEYISLNPDGCAAVQVKGRKEGKTYIYAVYNGITAVYPFEVIRRTTVDVRVQPEEGASALYEGTSLCISATPNQPATCTWDFGDGSAKEQGNDLRHTYTQAGTYTMTIEVDGYTYTHDVTVAPLTPVITMQSESTPVVANETWVSLSATLYNTKNKSETLQWIFPDGTTNENGQAISTFTGNTPGRVRFSHAGSNLVQVAATYDGRKLDTVGVFVQVIKDLTPAPTLYYAVKGGDIMARKLSEGADYSYDLGVSAGEHVFNMLFANSLLYVIDAGKQFTYINDEDGIFGDGMITAITPDGTKIDTVISNVGGHAFQDPFYGYVEGDDLYYTDRSTGVFRIPLTTRNAQWNSTEYPYYVQNQRLGYYSRGLSYAAINSCIGKVEGLWYWGKTYNGCGIWRFTDSDILPDIYSYETAESPEAGGILEGMFYHPKAFVYDSQRRMFYFSLYGNGAGVYKIPYDRIDELKYIGAVKELAQYTMDADVSIEPIAERGRDEGSDGEYIGICQMAIDEGTGDVYFGYRAADPEQTGLYRYNAATGKLTLIPDTKGIEIYGVTVNNTPTVLF